MYLSSYIFKMYFYTTCIQCISQVVDVFYMSLYMLYNLYTAVVHAFTAPSEGGVETDGQGT